MLLLCLTIWVDLLPMHSIHSLSKTSESLVFIWQTTINGMIFTEKDYINSSLRFNSLDILKLFKSISISVVLYSLLLLSKSIPSINLKALTTRALLIFVSQRCQRRMCLFWLTRWVSRLCLVITIAFGYILTVLIVAMALLCCASSSIKRFEFLLSWVMTFLSFIKVITARLSWYVYLLS